MSRTGRTNVEHETATKVRAAINNMPEGVTAAVSKLAELNEKSSQEEVATPIPDGFRDLVLFGRVRDEIKFGNNVFKVSTLTNRQQKEILKKIIPLSNEEKLINIKVLTLSEAISSVNGVPLETLYFGDDVGLTIFEKRMEVLSEFQAGLVDKLFEFYEGLLKKSQSVFSDGGISETSKNS